MNKIDYGKMAMDVFDELNLARQVPNAIVSGLSQKLENFEDNFLNIPAASSKIETYEGAKAVRV